MNNAGSKSLGGRSPIAIIAAAALLTSVQFAPYARANWLTEILERAAVNAERNAAKAAEHAEHDLVIEHPEQATHDAAPGSGLHSLVENRLRAAYQSKALDEITDAGTRERIRNVIGSHTTAQLASFAGREKQFAAVVASAQYTMKMRYGRSAFNTNDKNHAIAVGTSNSEVLTRLIISGASDHIPISSFSSESSYRQALLERLSHIGKALTEENPRWKFSISSGELEIPLSIKVGKVEIATGSVNLYEIATKASEKVFNGSALVAALVPVDGDQSSTQSPSPQLVSHEESQRRQLETSLTGDDLSELKQIAPDLFS